MFLQLILLDLLMQLRMRIPHLLYVGCQSGVCLLLIRYDSELVAVSSLWISSVLQGEVLCLSGFLMLRGQALASWFS